MSGRSYLSIGDVLSLLREEFPDVTISKIRFLESQGLVDPERSPSGYRKFYDDDVARLRWVLRKQRDQFLPLKVIRDRLAAAGNGVPVDPEPDEGVEVADRAALSGRAEVAETQGDKGDPAGAAGGSEDASSRAHPVMVEPAVQASNGTTEPSPAEGHGDVRGIALDDRGRVAAPASAPASAPAAVQPPQRSQPPTPTTAVMSAVQGQQGVLSAASPSLGEGGSEGGSYPSSRPAHVAGLADNEHSAHDSRSATAKAGAAGAAEVLAPSVSSVSLTLAELCAATGLTPEAIASLEGFGLLAPMAAAGGTYYDEEALTVGKLVVEFSRYGVEPRHLRMYRNAADREIGLVEQVITPLLRQRNPEARQRAIDAAKDLARLGQAMRASLVRAELRRKLGS
jgi:DNA-binding transcriptional MerR regulator